jgi:hypothetical protein
MSSAFSDVVGLNDISYNLYLESRAIGRDHEWSFRYATNPEAMCVYCESFRSDEEVMNRTCYECTYGWMSKKM